MRARAQHKIADEGRDSGALAELLRGAGLRRTGPRMAVLERLSGADQPLSHAEICEQLGGLGLDRATVYRNLIDLTEAGLVERTDLGDHVWRFELRSAQSDHAQKHPHLVCTGCGEVSCLTDVKVELKVVKGARRPIDTSALEVQLKGRCERCE